MDCRILRGCVRRIPAAEFFRGRCAGFNTLVCLRELLSLLRESRFPTEQHVLGARTRGVQIEVTNPDLTSRHVNP